MKRPARYHTKQSGSILSYVASLGGEHTTANQIQAHFSESGSPIGIATIYRHLERFVENGILRKYTIDGISGACYQYCCQDEGEPRYFHLKCENCGQVTHHQHALLDPVERRVLQESSFQINPRKTVFYGTCAGCSKKKD